MAAMATWGMVQWVEAAAEAVVPAAAALAVKLAALAERRARLQADAAGTLAAGVNTAVVEAQVEAGMVVAAQVEEEMAVAERVVEGWVV